MSDVTSRHGLGGNNPPFPTLAEQLDPVTLNDQWELDYAAVLLRRDTLLAEYEAFRLALTPVGTISSAEQDSKAMDFAKQLRDVAKSVQSHHDLAKRPFLAAGRAADAFFIHGISQPLLESQRSILGMSDVWKRREEARRRREADAAREAAAKVAREAAEKAAKLEAEARRTQRIDTIEKAEIAAGEAKSLQTQANRAERQAEAPAASFSRTRGDRGSVSSLVDNWMFEVIKKSEVPLEFMMLDEAKLRLAIRRKDDPLRDCPGLRIWNERTTKLHG